MTKNQIEFNKLLETRRANQAQEILTRRRDDRSHSLGLAQLGETSKHNRATESLDSAKLVETTRSNKEREKETHRANVAKEDETKRSNIARESETQRHNERTEAIDIGRAATYAGQLAETLRHNLRMESKNLRPQVIVTGSSSSSTSTSDTKPSEPIEVEYRDVPQESPLEIALREMSKPPAKQDVSKPTQGLRKWMFGPGAQ